MGALWGVGGCSQGRLHGRRSPELLFKGERGFSQAERGRNNSREGGNAINPYALQPCMEQGS